MENNALPSLYFSAYPLKVINKDLAERQGSPESPVLRKMLSGKTKSMSRVRVFPMINPYRQTDATKEINRNNHTPCFGLTEKEWFKNYE